VLKGACYDGLSLWVRGWLEDMASYRLFIEPYRNKISQDDVDLYIRILVAAENLAQEKYGVATLIPYLAWPEYLKGTGFSDDEIVQRLRDGGASVVDVSLAKEEAAGAKPHIEGDPHPTPLANRLRASKIKDYIEKPHAWDSGCGTAMTGSKAVNLARKRSYNRAAMYGSRLS
jgi:hypothetical protein